jgi:hypothetical protein
LVAEEGGAILFMGMGGVGGFEMMIFGQTIFP